MIGIKYNGQFLEMPSRYSLNMVENNSMFDFSAIEGDFSYSFSLPLTDKNKILLDFPEVIENNLSMGKEFAIELFLDSDFWKYATMVTGKVADVKLIDQLQSIEVTLKSGPGEFVTKLAKKPLKEIDYNCYERIPEAYRYYLTLIGGLPSAVQVTDNIYVDLYVGGSHYTYTKFCTNKSLHLNVKVLCDQINADTADHGCTASYLKFLTDPVTGMQRCFFYIRQTEFINKATYAVFTVTFNNYPDPVHLTDINTPIDNDFSTDFFPLQYHMNNLLLWPFYRDFFTACNYAFPYMANRNWGGDTVKEGFTLPADVEVNTFLAGSYIMALNDAPWQQAIPFPFVVYILQKMVAELGYSLTGSLANDWDFNKLILENVVALDMLEEFENDYVAISAMFGHKIDIKNHVGKITCSDLLLSLKATFGAVYDFSAKDKALVMTTIKEILLRKEYENWTAKAGKAIEKYPNDYDGITFRFTFDSGDEELSNSNSDITKYTLKEAVNTKADLPSTGNKKNDLRKVLDHNFWYLWQFVGFGTPGAHYEWVEQGEAMNDLKIANGVLEITSGLSPAAIFKGQYVESMRGGHPFGDVVKTVMPVAKQPGCSFYFDFWSDYVPKLLFWRDVQKDGDNNDYPMASMDVWDYDMNRLGTYAIKWDGTYGLVAFLLQEWIDFLKGTKAVTFPLYLSKWDLLHLDMLKKKMIDRNMYFLERLELNFTEEGLGDQTGYFKLYKPLAEGASNAPDNHTVPCITLVWDDAGSFQNRNLNENEEFSVDLIASGCCEGEKTFSLYSGTLPSGMTFDGNAIYGTPTKPCGTYNFVIKLEDFCGNVRYYPCVWVVICCETLDWTNPNHTDSNIGDTINWILTATGCCEGVKTFTLISGSLPPGLSFDNGVITGTITGPCGTYNFTIGLVDECGNTRTYPQTWNIPCCTDLDWTDPSNYEGHIEDNVNIPLDATGCCDGAKTFSIDSGSLPGGLTLSGNRIVGVITAPCGLFDFVLRLTDGCGNSKTYNVTFNVLC